VLFRPYLTLSRLRCSYDRTGAPGCRAGVRDDLTAVTTPPGLTVWACWGMRTRNRFFGNIVLMVVWFDWQERASQNARGCAA
jgi:hypothetical protein